MLPAFDPSGDLPPGIHWATWIEIEARFGSSPYRGSLLRGLKSALDALRAAGCQTAYVDGSFVTAKALPGDYDACWDPSGVDLSKLDPVLLTFDPGRVTQKLKYGGELFPSTAAADAAGSVFLDFFQVNKDTGVDKGIVAIDLRGLP